MSDATVTPSDDAEPVLDTAALGAWLDTQDVSTSCARNAPSTSSGGDGGAGRAAGGPTGRS